MDDFLAIFQYDDYEYDDQATNEHKARAREEGGVGAKQGEYFENFQIKFKNIARIAKLPYGQRNA